MAFGIMQLFVCCGVFVRAMYLSSGVFSYDFRYT